jgi:hypothetical protein
MVFSSLCSETYLAIPSPNCPHTRILRSAFASTPPRPYPASHIPSTNALTIIPTHASITTYAINPRPINASPLNVCIIIEIMANNAHLHQYPQQTITPNSSCSSRLFNLFVFDILGSGVGVRYRHSLCRRHVVTGMDNGGCDPTMLQSIP